ncbi:MAG: hypothetical protein R2764_24405 [Bacteroidales bacterium]
MKNTILIFIMLVIIFSANVFVNDLGAMTSPSQEDTLKISATSPLYYLVNEWVNEYGRTHPEAKIELKLLDETSIMEVFNSSGHIGFMSNTDFASLDAISLWKMVLGRDVIVPVFNSNNPLKSQIDVQGISPGLLSKLVYGSAHQTWGTLLGNNLEIPVKFYLSVEDSKNPVVINFLNENESIQNATIVKSRADLISAIQKDPYAIGLCNLAYIISDNHQDFVENILPIPMDRNENGEIDYQEKMYDDLHSLARGIWIGKYPKAFINSIYSVSLGEPNSEMEVEFLKWILMDGQKMLNENGYCDLILSERHSKLSKFAEEEFLVVSPKNQYATQKIILLLIVSVIALGFIVNAVFRYVKRKKGIAREATSFSTSILNQDSISVPNGLYFDKSHTWAFMEKDGNVKVGIDDFLQHVMGPVTRTILKKPGDRIKKGEQLMTLVQDGKQLNVYAPISGLVEEINEALITEPSVINASPYDAGWLYLIQPSNWLREIQFMKMAESYKEWLINEFTRLKDFLTTYVNANRIGHAMVVYQDGGELEDNVMKDLGPELWEDFQKHFIDNAQLR